MDLQPMDGKIRERTSPTFMTKFPYIGISKIQAILMLTAI
jgi:hypothetical protein